MSRLQRFLRHVFTGTAQALRAFTPATLAAIEQAIATCERRHSGEIRFVVEASLDADQIRRNLTPRQRAIEIFAQQRVWDTEHNNGVLIYVLFADHGVEIVADRGVAGGRVPQADWDAACRRMEQHFRQGRFAEGAVAGIEAVADILARFPADAPRKSNELPDAPSIIP